MDIRDFFVNPDDTILSSIKVLDTMAKKIVLVVENQKLVGVVTDGDLRRWILKNGDLTDCVSKIMNSHPIYITENERGLAKKIFIKRKVDALPVLDSNYKICDIIF